MPTTTSKSPSTPLGMFSGPRNILGTTGDDFMLITGSDDTMVYALTGDDTVSFYGDADHIAYGSSGDDTININGSGEVSAYGGADNDRFNVNSKADNHLDGGDGYDIADFRGLIGHSWSDEGFVFDLMDGEVTHWYPSIHYPMLQTFENIEEIYGSYWDDKFIGSHEDDIVYGVGGFDIFYGNNGDDTFYASDQGSLAYGWQDDDHLIGGLSADEFHGGNGNDTLEGGGGDDELHGDGGDDVILGGDGNDIISAGTGRDDVNAGKGEDTVYATASRYDHDRDADFYHGGWDNDRDTLSYEHSDVAVYLSTHFGVAGALNDGDWIGLDEFDGFETFIGSQHDDFLRSNNAGNGGFGGFREVIKGAGGDDTVYASKGDDIYEGGTGFDTADFSGMYSSVRFDLSTPVDGLGHDAIIENGDHRYHLREFESFVGSRNDDSFTGDDKDNWFEGFMGNDTATGGEGNDTFVFRDGEGTLGYDRVTDFTRGEDMLLLEGLNLWDGTAVDSAQDLDTNGNGILDNGDQPVFTSSEGTALYFAEGTILLENVTGIGADDLLFA